jgi:hypothetical protein
VAPVTHAFIGWWTANVLPLSRRDRGLVLLAGILPDLDGLTLFYSHEAYVRYHHVIAHNLLGAVICTAAVALFARQRLQAAVLAFLGWHLHLICDYFGSAGPDGPWVLPYLYPFVGGWGSFDFEGPAWYWNPWQWQLNGWPNLLVTLLGFIGWIYIAVKLDRTWCEFIWVRMDQELCAMFRRWFGGQAAEEWPEPEGALIRRSFVAVTCVSLMACVVAGAQAMR